MSTKNYIGPYLALHPDGPLASGWAVWKVTTTGYRRIGTGMSERTARRVARLLNADELLKEHA